MKSNEARSVIVGNIEAIDQGIELVGKLTDSQYCHVAAPYVQSSIGQHFRHVVDMFFAIVASSSEGIIDYDRRRRGAAIETERQAALNELAQAREAMQGLLSEIELLLEQPPVAIKSEVTIEQTHSVVINSTTLRELIFTSSHAVHHYALISVIAKLQGISLDKNVGIAPATATFLRNESNASGKSAQNDTLLCAQ